MTMVRPSLLRKVTAWLGVVAFTLTTLPLSGCKKTVGPEPLPQQITPQQATEQLAKLFPVLEAADREIPRDTFDLQAIVDKAGREPAALFKWVRDETSLVPYRGVLRGSTGVLMDRLGNSLDRALLLASLLRAAGQTVRLAHTVLSEEQARDVLEKSRAMPAMLAAKQPSKQEIEEVLDKYSKQYQLDITQLRKSYDQRAEQAARLEEQINQRVAQQASSPGFG